MKRMVITNDNMSIQEKDIYSRFDSEPSSFLLKFEFNETCKLNS